MYAILRENRYDPARLAEGQARLDEFQALHASQPGYRGTIAIDAGDGRWFLVNLWDSKEDAANALPRMVSVVKRLLEPMMATPSKLLGQGPALATDLGHV